MAVVFLLAHFDDEYCALPLILEAQAAGSACRFVYVADYASAADGRRRLAETRAFLARYDIPPEAVIHAGAGTGALDGQVVRHLSAALPAVRAAVGRAERMVTVAWEGGHPDHDACAAMATVIAGELGVPVDQVGLYNGRRIVRPLYRACWPLPQNGPERRIRLSPRQWARWTAGVLFFPSQAWNWLGLWPAMFLTFALRGGFACQRLEPARIRERPHPGRLHYEWMFRTPYEEVRARIDEMLGS